MEIIPLAIAFVGGLVLGLLYFGGLLLTVRQLCSSQQPAMMLFLSFLIRVALLLGGMLVVTAGRWERIVAFLVGLLMIRIILTRAWTVSDRTARPIQPVSEKSRG